jgi:hypothetical protein
MSLHILHATQNMPRLKIETNPSRVLPSNGPKRIGSDAARVHQEAAKTPSPYRATDNISDAIYGLLLDKCYNKFNFSCACPRCVRINSDMTRIGPHSRPHKLAVIDGRRAEARRLKEVRAELTAHVGGNPSTTQKMVIARIAMLTLRMELMDGRALKTGDMTEKDAREYLAWNNTVSRMLMQLGVHAAPARPRTLADHLASKAAAA